ncbi:hypothetical protein K6119_07045 [Paracrocinitomix mangrovi]|uniref:GldM family protein n=1 Tax=Paracrocinitomix mangrovi TaxID=2862509 RepID=UPI001C8DF158|nr:GldM family protein [Paracrocinitomix mangrovi]UKN03270.1 hypothetical protein K6119_07045 [Paracrocinitomix mangrovi]
MAGGKETPRQKMIGMMYLVLTALLALNVAKQIVAAFVTLNNKLDNSAEIIDIKAKDAYSQIGQKKAAVQALEGDLTEVLFWEQKAYEMRDQTAELIGFLLGECNDMIYTAEGEDWVENRDENGNITQLRPLDDIQSMDNYDIPTNMFVGGNPNEPNDRGLDLINRIHAYRNAVTSSMGTYKYGGKDYSFTAPENSSGLADAFKTANPVDTSKISQMYKTLTIPEKLYSHGEEELMPWVSVMFDHAPIVAAAAMFTSLKLDVKNAESMAAAYFVSKIDAPMFDFNKIEPMPIAQTAYINQGDSLGLRVMIAAYDTNDIAVIKYGIDGDTIPERWKETKGGLSLSGQSPGEHRVKGVIGVNERGDRTWRPWEFNYTVGQPMGVVAQPEMRVLYWGYDNVIEATGSGFPSENISVSTSGCRIERKNGKMLAKVERGTRRATIGVVGRNEDGTTTSLGSFEFKCVPLPGPELTIDGAINGSDIQYVQGKNFSQVRLAYDESITLTGVKFDITGGEIRVEGVGGAKKILPGGRISSDAGSILNQCRGKTISGEVSYRDPSGITKRESFSFKVKR